MSKKQSSFNTRDLKSATPKAKHNLSYRNILSAPFGALLPFMVQEVVAGSSVQIGLEHQTRAQSMPRPSFSRLREHFDYFFVPFSQLYRAYDNMRTQQSNYNSALFQQEYDSLPQQLPYFQLSPALMYPDIRGLDEKDSAGMPAVYGTIRLLDLLGYGVNANVLYLNPTVTSTATFQTQLNPFRLLAYQKIYYDYFRNDKYESNDSQFYNVDDLYSAASLNISTNRLKLLTRLEYRWRKKDYFTQVTPDVLPTPNQFNRKNFGTIITMSTTVGYISQLSSPLDYYSSSSSQNKIISRTANPVTDPDVQSTPIGNAEGSRITFANGSQTLANASFNQSVVNHKWASAVDKLFRRMYAANSDFSSQMLAIFGVAPVEGRHGRVSHIGGYSQILGISDVDNMTQSSPAESALYGNTVDPVFGKINQYGDTDNFTYRAKEDGIIMGIYSTSMESDYSSARIDRHNLKLRTYDYFIPEFANLGKQALFSVEYQNFYLDTSGDADQLKDMPLGVIGFVPRYDEYRTHVDECHGSFAFGSNEAYVAPMNADMAADHLFLNMDNLIYKPTQVDRIFSVNADGKEDNDPFYLNLYNKVKCISPVPLRIEL